MELLHARSPSHDDDAPPEVTIVLPVLRSTVKVRVFHGRSGPGQACLVYMHAGYFHDGHMDNATSLARALVNDATVVVVDYPLAPTAVFPVALEICLSVLEWAARNPTILESDPLKLYVGGELAGGNLAAATAMVARDRHFNQRRQRRLAGQILITPLLDPAQATPSLHAVQMDTVRRAWSEYLPRPHDIHHPYASPLRSRRLHGLAPALIVTNAAHPLRDEAQLYASQLRQAGVPADVRHIGTYPNTAVTARHPHLAATAAAVIDFVRSHAS